jgi:hypothetical protein
VHEEPIKEESLVEQGTTSADNATDHQSQVNFCQVRFSLLRDVLEREDCAEIDIRERTH